MRNSSFFTNIVIYLLLPKVIEEVSTTTNKIVLEPKTYKRK